MKKIIKPAEREESVYYSDFSGKPLCEFGPDVEVKISCGYGSKYDGTDFILHVDDNDLEKIVDALKNWVSDDFKSELKKKLDNQEEEIEKSMQMRDWDHCDMLSDNAWFIRKFLNINYDEEN